MDNSALILNELQSLRADFNEYARNTGERLSALETSMKALVGNGQPGRVGKLESDVGTLQKNQYKAAGFGAGVMAVIDLLISVFK